MHPEQTDAWALIGYRGGVSLRSEPASCRYHLVVHDVRT